MLGHTRLRIIDLSEVADQPLTNEDQSLWVVYNGEIYNFPELRTHLEAAGHTFKSHTDSEVLLHLYEEVDGVAVAMLERLRGMFAFALFDRPRSRLLLARDRLGIKPMYWAERGNQLGFGSEVRALAAAGFTAGGPDPQSVLAYLRWGVVPGPRSIVAGVSELPPGSFLDWTNGRMRVERWWRPRPAAQPQRAGDARSALGEVLADAVNRHLIADRPVGAFLSGGVDSGAVVTVAARQGPVRALTVTFPDAHDEGDAAHALAQRVGATHERVPVLGTEVLSRLPTILSAMDQPTLDGVNSWIVCRATREAGLVVALSGLGGDELFGGYPSARLVPKLAALNAAVTLVPRSLRNWAAERIARDDPGSRLARILSSGEGYVGAYRAVRSVLAIGERQSDGLAGAVGPHIGNGTAGQDKVMLLEMAQYLPNQLLRDTDQMSMAHALEVRVPLLDDEVVRVALELPAAVRTARGKRMLAEAAGMGETNAKRPFTLPFADWMRGPLRETVREALLSDDLPFGAAIDAGFRQRLWSAFEAGRTHWSRPWSVAVLRLWPAANGFAWR